MSELPEITVPAGTAEWAKQHRKLYLASGGTRGHIMDITGAGGFPFATHCLIRYQGRKSGKTMITGLCYNDYAGEVVIVASKGGAPDNPQWYNNILASKTIDIQIATEAFRATWREPAGAERTKIWNFMADCFPFYDTYQKRTERQIPIVMFKTIETLPVFKESDVTE